jgi:hypothetical protein
MLRAIRTTIEVIAIEKVTLGYDLCEWYKT